MVGDEANLILRRGNEKILACSEPFQNEKEIQNIGLKQQKDGRMTALTKRCGKKRGGERMEEKTIQQRQKVSLCYQKVCIKKEGERISLAEKAAAAAAYHQILLARLL